MSTFPVNADRFTENLIRKETEKEQLDYFNLVCKQLRAQALQKHHARSLNRGRVFIPRPNQTKRDHFFYQVILCGRSRIPYCIIERMISYGLPINPPPGPLSITWDSINPFHYYLMGKYELGMCLRDLSEFFKHLKLCYRHGYDATIDLSCHVSPELVEGRETISLKDVIKRDADSARRMPLHKEIIDFLVCR
jgi:hypothetical protein